MYCILYKNSYYIIYKNLNEFTKSRNFFVFPLGVVKLTPIERNLSPLKLICKILFYNKIIINFLSGNIKIRRICIKFSKIIDNLQ